MRTTAAAIALVAVLIAAIVWMSVVRVPADSFGVAGEDGGSTVLEPGFHFRTPFSPRPAIYSVALPPASGEVEIATAEGITCKVSFEAKGRIDAAGGVAFHRAASQVGAGSLLRQAATGALLTAASSRPAADLATGALEPIAAREAGALLAASGVSEVTLKLGPLDPQALLRLAQGLATQRLAGLLREPVAAAVAATRGWEALTAMGLVLESEHDLDGAEKQYLDALTLRPTALPPMAQLAALYTTVGRYEKLDRLLKTALEVDPKSTQHLNWLSVSLMKQGRYADAEQFLRRALTLDPDNPLIMNNVGGIQLKMGNLEGAAETFRMAVQKAPEDGQSQYNLGITLSAEGKFEEGLPYLLNAEKAGARGAPLFSAIALAYKRLGESGKAADYERRARQEAGSEQSVAPR